MRKGWSLLRCGGGGEGLVWCEVTVRELIRHESDGMCD